MIIYFLLIARVFAADVVCTLPWLGSLTAIVAPDADITVLARGNEDPHYLSPTPALMARVGKADVYVESGLQLELWSERLLDGAGNPKIRPGQSGYVLASKGVSPLQIPTQLTRAQGDLHPSGNPHIWLDPLNAIIAADNIAAGLSRVDPENAAAYKERSAAFNADIYSRMFGDDLVGFMGGELLERLARSGKLREFLDSKGLTGRLGGWMKAGEALNGKSVVFYHQSWIYFVDRFGLVVVGHIEDRPGIAPSAAHRQELEAAMMTSGAGVIGVTSYYDNRLANVLGDKTGARVVSLPGDVGGTAAATDYFALIDTLIASLGD